jgi:hypothetical protein
MDDLCPSFGDEAAGKAAEIADAFFAALQADVQQEQTGHLAMRLSETTADDSG